MQDDVRQFECTSCPISGQPKSATHVVAIHKCHFSTHPPRQGWGHFEAYPLEMGNWKPLIRLHSDGPRCPFPATPVGERFSPPG